MLYEFIGQYLWPFMRIGALFMAVPVIGARTVPARIRLMLALVVTALVSPLLPSMPAVDFISVPAFLRVLNEVLIGLALGFCFQVVMHVFVLSGQLVAMKMGLGFASMNDPSNGISVTVISQFYLLLSTVLFLVFNGHLFVIELVVRSFSSIPVDQGIGFGAFAALAGMGSWMFNAALVFVLPLFTALLVINMSFGIMNRSAPQINVFTVGFPIALIFGLIFMWIGLVAFIPYFSRVFDASVLFAEQLMRVN
jgi:flagellar biosynthetic protein FliR